MLAPDYLDHAPDRLVLLWQQVEDDILRDVARRISKMDTMTPTAHWQLWRYQQVEALRQDVVKKLARYTGKSEAEIRRLMQEAATRAMEAEDEIYYHYGKEPTPFADNATLQALLNAGYQQTAGTFHNLTATTANTVSGQFEAALDRALEQGAAGLAQEARHVIGRNVHRPGVRGVQAHAEGVVQIHQGLGCILADKGDAFFAFRLGLDNKCVVGLLQEVLEVGQVLQVSHCCIPPFWLHVILFSSVPCRLLCYNFNPNMCHTSIR